MTGIDDKVVSMSFEASKFESGVNQAIRALEKLKSSLNFPHAGKGLDDIGAAARRIDLSRIGQGVGAVKSKLSALNVAAVAIFANIALSAAAAGARVVKAFAIGPIIDGFHEYATNLNAIQTILANTQASGANLNDVNKALNELNRYSDKTIYNFSQMAKNIGTFTAAGVDLKTSTASIKGIANLAALSGSNADQASTAMYQLSQAIAAGSVKLQDWNSVVNAGMGGTVFQRALAQTAEAMGTLKKGTVDLVGPMKNVTINGQAFRQSLSTPGKASWLTSKVLTTTLQQFTGDLSDAQLAAEGFNKAQIKAIQQTAKTAQHAATEVKTISQVLDVAKETAGSGWAQTFQIIFGNFVQAKTTFTKLSNTINGFINTNARARNKVLADWKALGGRTHLIDGIKTAFTNLGKVLQPIKDAFRDFFPAKTGRDLYDLTLKFQNFAKAIKPSQTTIDNLRRTFRGVFAILDIGKQIIAGVVGMFARLFHATNDSNGGILGFTGNIGDFIVNIDKALKKGNKLGNFFNKLGDIIAVPIKFFGKLRNAIGDFLGGKSSGGFSKWLSGITKSMHPFQAAMHLMSSGWDKLMSSFKGSSNIFQPEIDKIMASIKNIGPAIKKAVSNLSFDPILAVVKTGLFAGLVLMFKSFLGKGSFVDQIGKGIGGAGGGFLKNVNGMVANISGSFKALEGSMVAIQQNIKAKTLKEIAIAVGLLAGSVVAISLVNPKRLNSALSAMTIGFGELLGAMKVLTIITKTTGFVKLPFVAAGLIALAGAIDVLSFAVISMSFLSWDSLVKGLTGVGALLVGLVASAKPLSAASKGMIASGFGIAALAVGLNILAFAVKQFGNMKWSEMGKGLTGVGGGLVILAAGMRAMPKAGMFAIGAGLIAVGIGLNLMVGPIMSFSKMHWKSMGKGLSGLGAALIIIGAGTRTMGKTLPLVGAGLIALAYGLKQITNVVITLSKMNWKTLAKGLGGLAGMLVILAAAVGGMEEAGFGVLALVSAAFGLKLLAGVLTKLGGMSWGSILKGLFVLGAALTIIGVAGALLTPAIPSLLGLGAALLLIGAGLTLVGTGIFLIGTGLSALAVGIGALISMLIDSTVKLAKAIPEMVTALVAGLVQIGGAIVTATPAIIAALKQMIQSLVTIIIAVTPVVVDAFITVMKALLKTITDNKSNILQAGLDLMMALIHGILSGISQLAIAMGTIIANVVLGVARGIAKIVVSGASMLMALVRGILSRIGQMTTSAVSAVTRFISGIVSGIGRIVTSGVNMVTGLVTGIAKTIGRLVTSGVNAVIKFITGIFSAGGRISNAGTTSASKLITAIAARCAALVVTGVQAVGHFMTGFLSAAAAAASGAASAGFNIGRALVQGVINGLTSLGSAAISKAEGIMNSVVGVMHKIPIIGSPSKVTTDIGRWMMVGLIKGLNDNASRAVNAAETVSKMVIGAFNDTFQTASPSKVMYQIGKYVGIGFAQGIRGSSDNIKSAFADLNQKLLDQMQRSKDIIKSENEQLKKAIAATKDDQARLAALRAAKKPDAESIKRAAEIVKEDQDAIAKINAIITENENALKRSNAAHILLTKTLLDEKAKLIGLANQYDKIAERLKTAQQNVVTKQKELNDAVTNFTTQYDALPDIVTKDAAGNSVDQLATYEDALKHQADAVAAYQTTLDALRKLGLDDATYQKLLAEGPADQQFADQLLAGGKTAVEGLNKLDAQLKANATVLATHAGESLYRAGVKSAQSVVKGLQSQEDELRKQMEKLARIMIKALKKELGMSSPSKEFMEIGRYSMEGMAQGLSKSSKIVTDALVAASSDALSAMKKSVRDISDVVTNELNPNPVITPVLDLTQVRSQTGELAALTKVVPITAATSYGQAALISSQQTADQADQTSVAPGGTSIKFEQTNNSPVALTEIEIYRQTKNQLSQLKSVLAT